MSDVSNVSNTSYMIDFINALQDACKLTQDAMTVRELADTFWLIYTMSSAQQEQFELPERETNFLQPIDEPFVQITMKQITEPQLDKEEKPTSRVYPYPTLPEPFDSNQPARNGTKGGMSVLMPDAPALNDTLVLGRALRPLRRRYPSGKRMVLNERATAHQIAEMKKQALVPVMEPSPERWFELALVIDESLSMRLWQQTILEVRTLFERLGAFRDIRIWSLATGDETSVQLYAGMRSSTPERFEHKPEELLDPTGRRLILVVTDCVSPAWQSGVVQKVLEIWGKTNLVTLLQMLPWRLWPTTALCFAENMYITNAISGTPNVGLKTPEFQALVALDTPFINDAHLMTATRPTPFPVITLYEESLSTWASMVMGTEDVKVAGVMFAKDSYILPSQQENTSLNPRKRARNFLVSASPTARKLAQMLSVTSVMLPVVHIIEQTLLPESRQEHVAEVFLSGMLQELSRNNAAKHHEYARYEFYQEAKEELWASLSLSDETRVHQAVSKYCEEHLGITRNNFLGVVDAPSSFAELAIQEENQYIADILISEWRQLSSDDAFLASRLEEQVTGKPGNGSAIHIDGLQDATIAAKPLTVEAQLRMARAETNRETRAIRLLDLLPQLNKQRVEIMHEALAIMRGVVCSKNYINALLAGLPYMPEEYKVEVIEEALESARLVTHEKEHAEALYELLQKLPEAWKAEAVQQMLTMTRNMTDTALKTSTLRTLLTAAPKSLTHLINREMGVNRKIGAAQTANKDLPNKKFRTEPSRTEFVCPSCFRTNFIGDCRILSGIGEHRVLKAAPKSPRQIDQAHKNPESLDTPFYGRELACRECPSCGYLVPREIEHFPSLALAIVGDTFSGKTHYITTLLHQLREEWINHTQSFMRLHCLTPDVETNFLRSYEQLFVENLALGPNTRTVDIPMVGKATKPLIYNLSIGSSLQEPPTTINLMLYDIAGEDFQRERLVQVAPFALGADAFIFVADPITMHPVLERLPASMQKNIKNTIKQLGSSLTDIRQQPDSLNDTLTLYNNFHRQRKTMSLPDTPVAVMVSKADLISYIPQAKCYSFTVNPRYSGSVDLRDMSNVDKEVKEFLREYRQGALLATTRILQHVQFFATSATGGPPDEQGRFKHVEPRRCLDPILWILYQLGIITASM